MTPFDAAPSRKNPVLEVRHLAVEFATYGGSVKAVRDVSFSVSKGEVLAIVGESGCGKSVTVQSIMGLIPRPPGKITSGEALLGHKNLLAMSEKEMEEIRGNQISMIFQDPLSSLNPTMTVGAQIAEVICKHRGLSRGEALKEAVGILRQVQIPEPERRLRQYPHEFSGGMRQRIMIAIALACRPQILIADEPTTALDVTIQGQILQLIRTLQAETHMAVIIITHDLGVVAALAHRVAVMYAGEIVEEGSVDDIFAKPQHPYTKGLLAAKPNPLHPSVDELQVIPGSPPDLFSPPPGCAFSSRCSYCMTVCNSYTPPAFMLGEKTGRLSRCWMHAPQYEGVPL